MTGYLEPPGKKVSGLLQLFYFSAIRRTNFYSPLLAQAYTNAHLISALDCIRVGLSVVMIGL